MCSKISGHSLIPCTSFQRRLESSVIYPSTSGRHLGSGFCRGDEYTAIGPIDAFDTDSKAMLGEPADVVPGLGRMGRTL